MKTDIFNGVESLEIAQVNPDGSLGAWVKVENIEDGTVSITSNADTKTNKNVEDKDAPLIVLYTPGDPDTFNLSLLEISRVNAERFYNIKYDEQTSTITFLSRKKRANLAYRLTSRPQFGVKRVFTWKNTVNSVTWKNNITKNDLLAISVSADILPWKDADGDDAVYTIATVTEAGAAIVDTTEEG